MDTITRLKKSIEDKQRITFEYKGKHRKNALPTKFINNHIVCVMFNSKGPEYNFTISEIKKLTIQDNKSNVKKKLESSVHNKTRAYYESLCINKIKNMVDNPEDYKNYEYEISVLKRTVEKLNGNQKKFNKKIFRKYLNCESAETVEVKQTFTPLIFQSNKSQKEALENALHEDVSIISGPPGTGKTQTILNIIANAISLNKTVLVVSKNNSAIDNIKEKLDEIDNLEQFYIRLGSKEEYMNSLYESLPNILSKKIHTSSSIINESQMTNMYKELAELEEKKSIIDENNNKLNDLLNEKRSLERKLETFDYNGENITLRRLFLTRERLFKELRYLIHIRSSETSWLKKLVFNIYSKFRFNVNQIPEDKYSYYLWTLEKEYLEISVQHLRNRSENEDELIDRISNLYKEYLTNSLIYINDKSRAHTQKDSTRLLTLVEDGVKDEKYREFKKLLLDRFPVVLTTLDSVHNNVWSKKYDFVIIDEASQADVLSSFDAINNAEQLVIVGDDKQLMPIFDQDDINHDEEYLFKNKVELCFLNSKNSILTSIKESMKPKEILLKEHYRCDYNIINFCNKQYYNGELVICNNRYDYKSMRIIDTSKQRSSFHHETSYANNLEIEEIFEHQKDERSESLLIITPYRPQADLIKERLQLSNGEVGTIHTFQGRESNEVYMSTVLTKEKGHLRNTSLIDKNLINVSVSRAKDCFTLVTHKEFFEENSKEVAKLIEYIELHGEILTSKVNSIFDYLYKDMAKEPKLVDHQSHWEKALHNALLEEINKNDLKINVRMHMGLGDIIVNKDYLTKNPDLRSFATSKGAHLDFLLTNVWKKPILAIELDGNSHNSEEQTTRDRKKDRILADMNIKLWRIKSTDIITEENLHDSLLMLLPEEYLE